VLNAVELEDFRMTAALPSLFRSARPWLLGAFVVVAAATVLPALAREEDEERPILQPWHTVVLQEEFRAGDEARIKTIADYQALETRLFAELDERVYAAVDPREKSLINRYWAGSDSDPRTSKPDWSRTMVLSVDKPRGGVLLVHGLSDSPYIMRGLAEYLHGQGWHVVVLRLPGHGTAPSGLLEVKWQDWAAAVRLAAKDIVATVGTEKPLVLAGFSTGGALAVEYALSQRQGEPLPKPAHLLLFSPAIGVSSLGRVASTVNAVAKVPGLDKLGWETISLEYDPYKYNSFPVNAGAQIWKLTQRIDDQLSDLKKHGGATGLPRILAFQSIADATVSTEAVIEALYGRLPSEGHRLVLFDANRVGSERQILKPDLFAERDRLLGGPARPFDLEIVTNERDDEPQVSSWIRAAGGSDVQHVPTNLRWPRDLFALSHVAVPVPAEDPVYGETRPARQNGRIWLGHAALYGERDMLLVPEAALLRLRYNPFFPWMTQRIDEFLGAPANPVK
jgi:alpha-beta hydrolase superfamily lysophospholipase